MKGGRAQASKDVPVQFAPIPPQRLLRSPARRQSWLHRAATHPYGDQSIPQRNTQTLQQKDISTYIM